MLEIEYLSDISISRLCVKIMLVIFERYSLLASSSFLSLIGLLDELLVITLLFVLSGKDGLDVCSGFFSNFSNIGSFYFDITFDYFSSVFLTPVKTFYEPSTIF